MLHGVETEDKPIATELELHEAKGNKNDSSVIKFCVFAELALDKSLITFSLTRFLSNTFNRYCIAKKILIVRQQTILTRYKEVLAKGR